MSNRRLTLLCALIPLLASATDAFACGQTMFQTGQATRYQSFIARHPANILVYRPTAAGAVAEANTAVYAGLEKAGHKVTVVSAPDELVEVLAKNTYDVIIAPSAEMDQIAKMKGQGDLGESRMLAVVTGDRDDNSKRPRRIKASDGVNTYLRSIDEMMRERGA